MATVEMVSTRVRDSALQATETHSHDTLADRVFAVGAMCGAAFGAASGAILGASTEGVYPIIAGTLGVLVGSGVVAVVARYAILPLWAACFAPGEPRA